MESPTLHTMPVGDVGVYTHRCPGKDSPNEDAAAIISCGPEVTVLAVADGLGGTRGGGLASNTAIEVLADTLGKSVGDKQPPRAAILNGIENANRAVMELGTGGATTIAVVEIAGGMIRPYHVGDSAILLTGRRGKIKLQTVSHSPVGFAVAAGWLDEEEALHHEARHFVSNVLGSPEMSIEIGSSTALAPLDTLVLASDGLLDNLRVDEIVERVRRGKLEKAVGRLYDDANARMNDTDEGHPSKPDDLTFIVFRPRR